LGQNRNIIDLETAAGDIKQACEKHAEGPARSPFFFFVGSGISTPSVPLASVVCKECEALARKRGRTTEPTSAEPGSAYSHWFREAFPHRVSRQQFLQKLIKDAPITHANLRLAHLLIDRSISTLAVTTNFDDLLFRALVLFGETPTVCDNPRTVERIDSEKSDIQLVHVHGSHLFYDCSNTAGEIADSAQSSSETTQTMAALLDRILAFKAPIVCGYSGWANDVFMRALGRRLRSALPHNMYWFCFHRDECVALQKLIDHPDVYFIVADDKRTDASDAKSDPASAGVGERQATLGAKTVFDSLIRALDAKTPPLINDPLSFYANHLRSSLPKDEVESGGDIYGFKTVVERVERARKHEEDEIAKTQHNDSEMEAAREAIRGARYGEVFSHVDSIDKAAASTEQLSELVRIMETINTATYPTSPDAAARSADVFFECADILAGRGIQPDATAVVLISAIQGGLKYANRDYQAAITAYERGARSVGQGDDLATRRRIALIHHNLGLALRALGRNDAAIAAFDEAIKAYSSVADPELLDHAVSASAQKAVAFVSLGRIADAKEAVAEMDRLTEKSEKLSEYTKNSIESAKQLVSLAAH
jgi:tetratricopeptide (TPR) repeat protein